MEKSYTTSEVAEMIGVTQRAVSKWCKKGIIDAYRTSPRGDWMITKSSLIAYAEQNKIPLKLSQ